MTDVERSLMQVAREHALGLCAAVRGLRPPEYEWEFWLARALMNVPGARELFAAAEADLLGHTVVGLAVDTWCASLCFRDAELRERFGKDTVGDHGAAVVRHWTAMRFPDDALARAVADALRSPRPLPPPWDLALCGCSRVEASVAYYLSEFKKQRTKGRDATFELPLGKGKLPRLPTMLGVSKTAAANGIHRLLATKAILPVSLRYRPVYVRRGNKRLPPKGRTFRLNPKCFPPEEEE